MLCADSGHDTCKHFLHSGSLDESVHVCVCVKFLNVILLGVANGDAAGFEMVFFPHTRLRSPS